MLMTDVRNDPAEALAAVRLGREQVLAACACPPSRHAAFAAVMGGYVASPALPVVFRMATLALLLCSIAIIVRWDRRRTGMFVNGYRRGRTRKVTFAMLGVILPLYLLGSWLSDMRGLAWPSLVMGVVAAGLAYAGSLWWMRVFRREMLAVV